MIQGVGDKFLDNHSAWDSMVNIQKNILNVSFELDLGKGGVELREEDFSLPVYKV